MVLFLALAALLTTAQGWKELSPGIEYRTFALAKAPEHGDGLLHVVRVDPSKATFHLGLVSEKGGDKRTAAEWADSQGFVVTMNAGMFQLEDQARNVGYLRHGDHVNNPKWKSSYQSLFVFGPAEEGLPGAALLDRDAGGAEDATKKYRSVVQNLRLIKGDGKNVWKPNARRWSEAMVAADAEGRVLFLFSRTPFEMAELNAKVLALPLGVVRAMHAEGGPEASLSIRSKSVTLDLCGSYETGFNEDDKNRVQWPVPNVIGVR